MPTFILLTAIFVAVPLLCLLRREALVFSILFIASEALGLIDIKTFGIYGYFDINSILLIIYALSISISMARFKELGSSQFTIPFIIILLVGLFGVLYPVALGFSSLFHSLKESKEYTNYFCFFSVFLFVRTRTELDRCWWIVGAFALYFSLFEIIGNMAGDPFFSLFNYPYRTIEQGFIKVHIPVFTVMILTLLLNFNIILFRPRSPVHLAALFILISGMFLTFFRAYILGILCAIPLLLILNRYVGKSLAYTAVAIPILLLSLYTINITLAKGPFSDSVDSFITSGVVELYEYKGGALTGRDRVTEGRARLSRERPLLGWGFLDKDSKQGMVIRKTIGLSGAGEIGFVDKGYLDVVVKFGMVGAACFYTAFAMIFFRLVNMGKKVSGSGFKARIFATSGLLLTFLIAQLTHANLTRQFGIVPLSIALGLVAREFYLTSHTGRAPARRSSWSR